MIQKDRLQEKQRNSEYTGPAYNPNANPPTTPNAVWHDAQVYYGTKYLTPNGLSYL